MYSFVAKIGAGIEQVYSTSPKSKKRKTQALFASSQFRVLANEKPCHSQGPRAGQQNYSAFRPIHFATQVNVALPGLAGSFPDLGWVWVQSTHSHPKSGAFSR
jgi:hypothetical protein